MHVVVFTVTCRLTIRECVLDISGPAGRPGVLPLVPPAYVHGVYVGPIHFVCSTAAVGSAALRLGCPDCDRMFAVERLVRRSRDAARSPSRLVRSILADVPCRRARAVRPVVSRGLCCALSAAATLYISSFRSIFDLPRARAVIRVPPCDRLARPALATAYCLAFLLRALARLFPCRSLPIPVLAAPGPRSRACI